MSHHPVAARLLSVVLVLSVLLACVSASRTRSAGRSVATARTRTKSAGLSRSASSSASVAALLAPPQSHDFAQVARAFLAQAPTASSTNSASAHSDAVVVHWLPSSLGTPAEPEPGLRADVTDDNTGGGPTTLPIPPNGMTDDGDHRFMVHSLNDALLSPIAPPAPFRPFVQAEIWAEDRDVIVLGDNEPLIGLIAALRGRGAPSSSSSSSSSPSDQLPLNCLLPNFQLANNSAQCAKLSVVLLGNYFQNSLDLRGLYAALRLATANPGRVFLLRGALDDVDADPRQRTPAAGSPFEQNPSATQDLLRLLYEAMPVALFVGRQVMENNNSNNKYNFTMFAHAAPELGYTPRKLLQAVTEVARRQQQQTPPPPRQVVCQYVASPLARHTGLELLRGTAAGDASVERQLQSIENFANDDALRAETAPVHGLSDFALPSAPCSKDDPFKSFGMMWSDFAHPSATEIGDGLTAEGRLTSDSLALAWGDNNSPCHGQRCILWGRRGWQLWRDFAASTCCSISTLIRTHQTEDNPTTGMWAEQLRINNGVVEMWDGAVWTCGAPQPTGPGSYSPWELMAHLSQQNGGNSTGHASSSSSRGGLHVYSTASHTVRILK